MTPDGLLRVCPADLGGCGRPGAERLTASTARRRSGKVVFVFEEPIAELSAATVSPTTQPVRRLGADPRRRRSTGHTLARCFGSVAKARAPRLHRGLGAVGDLKFGEDT
jgi:hypothetical protein